MQRARDLLCSSFAPEWDPLAGDWELLHEPLPRAESVAFDAQGAFLALGCDDGSARLWNVLSRFQPVQTLASPYAPQVSPASSVRKARPTMSAKLPQLPTRLVTVAWTCDSRRLWAASALQDVMLWDVISG